MPVYLNYTYQIGVQTVWHTTLLSHIIAQSTSHTTPLSLYAWYMRAIDHRASMVYGRPPHPFQLQMQLPRRLQLWACRAPRYLPIDNTRFTRRRDLCIQNTLNTEHDEDLYNHSESWCLKFLVKFTRNFKATAYTRFCHHLHVVIKKAGVSSRSKSSWKWLY